MEKARYDRVIEACCLTVDLNQIPDRDMALVGENGTSLSGGQVARVALARALYSKSSLVLLDDIFSALDAKTSAEIWKQCFCSTLLNNRTIILVTQITWILSQADLTILLHDGCAKSTKVNIGGVRKPVTTAQSLGVTDPETESTVTPRANRQPNIYSINRSLGVADDVSANEIVNQEVKASGRSGRMGCKNCPRPLAALVELTNLSSLSIHEILRQSNSYHGLFGFSIIPRIFLYV